MTVTQDTEHKNLIYVRDISQDKFDKKIEFTPIISDYFAEFSLIDTRGSQFFFKTNWNASKGKIVMIDFKNYDKSDPRKSFQDVIPEDKKNPIAEKHGVTVADGKMMITYLVDASDRVKIYDFNIPANFLHQIKLPGIGSVGHISGTNK